MNNEEHSLELRVKELEEKVQELEENGTKDSFFSTNENESKAEIAMYICVAAVAIVYIIGKFWL